MKNIAVLIYDVINDYYDSILEGIISFYADKKDVRVVVATVCVPNDNSMEFNYQYWSTVEILKSKDIDGIIVITNSFMNKIDLESFSKELEDFANRPVVSVSAKLLVANSKYTCTVAEKSYDQVVKHLKEKHNRKRIAFLSGSMTDTPEAVDRFEAFKKALKNNDMEFYPELVFPGDFTPGVTKNEILKRYKSKEEIDFDAAIGVNDYAAGGCLLAFQELKVSCPEDVSIVGFDDSFLCLQTYPTLSSINQNIRGNGIKSAEIMYKLLNNQNVDEETILQCSPIYRQSCGCIESKTHSTAYFDENGTYFEIDEINRNHDQTVLLHSMETSESLYKLLNLMDSRIGMSKLIYLLKDAMSFTKISSIGAQFYSQQIINYSTDKFVLPDTAKVLIYGNMDKEIWKSYDEENAIVFSPRNRLIPEEMDSNNPGLYFLFPLFLRESIYGYLLCRTEQEQVSLTSVHLKILSNIFIQAYEYSRQEKNHLKLLNTNSTLSYESKTDELTQILNRRGFIERGKNLIDLSVSMGKNGCLLFCDMDGLKTINDSYGHDIGDLAIKTEAEVLKNSFKDSDIVGRLSGDEFAVVAPGLNISKINELRNRIALLNEKYSKDAKLPFTLSISIGAAEFSESNDNLMTLLMQADKKLYEEKDIKHSKK